MGCTCATVSLYYMFFFFSSRRRHTRLQGDWSSDVCSSDLCILQLGAGKSIMTISLHSCAFITPRIRTELHLATCSWPSSESSTPRRGVHAPLCSMSPWICGTEQVGICPQE